MTTETIRAGERLRKRQARLRKRLEKYGVEELPEGWRVASTRVAHRFIDGEPACRIRFVEDGTPLPAPISLCRKCSKPDSEDWSRFG
jgi:hypothetical protein